MRTRPAIVTACGAAVLLASAAGTLWYLNRRAPEPIPGGPAALVNATRAIEVPFLMFRTQAPPAVHGRVTMARAEHPRGPRFVTPLSCVRVHTADGRGVCLVETLEGRSVVHRAETFDDSFARLASIRLDGVPIRTRVSPNGRLLTVTVYGEEATPEGERLATRTQVYEVASGRLVADIGEFDLTDELRRDLTALTKQTAFGTRDVAGLGFMPDSDGFIATLAAADRYLLVSGSVTSRQLSILASDLAGEAVSPDGRRLAAKRLVGGRSFWQLVVFDLTTRQVTTPNQGPRSVDDQVEWFDNGVLMYHEASGESTGVWALPIDGTSGPRLLLDDAYSPSMAR
ncbi:MAG: hypothetical protein ACT4QD_04585 [Acidobacteriota bacterium]